MKLNTYDIYTLTNKNRSSFISSTCEKLLISLEQKIRTFYKMCFIANNKNGIPQQDHAKCSVRQNETVLHTQIAKATVNKAPCQRCHLGDCENDCFAKKQQLFKCKNPSKICEKQFLQKNSQKNVTCILGIGNFFCDFVLRKFDFLHPKLRFWR